MDHKYDRSEAFALELNSIRVVSKEELPELLEKNRRWREELKARAAEKRVNNNESEN